jgi:hypothetical protein
VPYHGRESSRPHRNAEAVPVGLVRALSLVRHHAQTPARATGDTDADALAHGPAGVLGDDSLQHSCQQRSPLHGAVDHLRALGERVELLVERVSTVGVDSGDTAASSAAAAV